MNNGKKFAIALFLIGIAILAIAVVLMNENALVFHPKGMIAHRELEVIKTNIFLMVIIVLPTLALLFIVGWKYHSKNLHSEHHAEHSIGVFGEILLWIIPSIIILVMAIINWYATHELDPYRPIHSDDKPLVIQVVAMDWKWLFIYPEQGIATLNLVQFPEKIPIRLELSADGSPMNSFWIPQLSGQIYSMVGMVTPLHLMADGVGEYRGKAAEINGKGYADMHFTAKSLSLSDFNSWVEDVKKTSSPLTQPIYDELLKPSMKDPIVAYSAIEPDLFNKIVMKYLHLSHTK